MFTDDYGLSTTNFGRVRRIHTAFGYGVRACDSFRCGSDEVVFVIPSCKQIQPEERSTWDGYTFTTSDGVDVIPPHQFVENYLHPPMMANAPCEELNEACNLKLFDLDGTIVFQSCREIRGRDLLLVDYGESYCNDLVIEREKARSKKAEDMVSRPNISFSHKCPRCGHTCQPKFAMKHFKICNKK